jgi:hypothetical protein
MGLAKIDTFRMQAYRLRVFSVKSTPPPVLLPLHAHVSLFKQDAYMLPEKAPSRSYTRNSTTQMSPHTVSAGLPCDPCGHQRWGSGRIACNAFDCGGQFKDCVLAELVDRGHSAHGFAMGQLLGNDEVSYLRVTLLFGNKLVKVHAVTTPAKNTARFLHTNIRTK